MDEMYVLCENCGCQVQLWNSSDEVKKYTGTCTLCGFDIEVDVV